MRPPVYTSRERLAIAIADRVVLRLYVVAFRDWVETEVLPTQFETLADALRRVQAHLAEQAPSEPRLRQVCLYVGGDHPQPGRMVAAVPTTSVPTEVEHPLVLDYPPSARETT